MKSDNSAPLLSLKAEHPFFYFTTPLYLLLFGLIFSAFFIAYGWIVKAILILLLLIIVRLFILKGISKVLFYENHVEVIYYSKRKRAHLYNEINVFREQKIGFYPIVSITGHLRDKKKFYFYCPKSKRSSLDDLLKIKGKNIRTQL